MIILEDIQNNRSVRRVAGFCPTSPDFIDLVNTAVRMLLRRGDFVGTVVPIYVCVYNGCVVWPRYVQVVRRLSHCHGNISVRNLWYDYAQGVHNGCNGGNGNWNNWSWNGITGTWFDNNGSLSQQGRTSLFQDIQGDGRLVRVYPRCPNDIGKTVTIFGTDNNGQLLQTQNLDGSFSTGVVLTMDYPFVSTNQYVRSIDYVLKDLTECPVDMFAYNVSADVLEPLATYDPSETRPSYQRTKLNITSPWNAGCATGCSKGVMALVKLKFIEAILPTDLIPIDNVDAISTMIQSIKAAEAGNQQLSASYQSDAVRELNADLENEAPDDIFTARNNTLGGATFSNQCF